MARLQEHAQLRVLMHLLAVLLERLDQVPHLQDRAGHVLPRSDLRGLGGLLALKHRGVFSDGREQEQVPGIGRALAEDIYAYFHATQGS